MGARESQIEGETTIQVEPRPASRCFTIESTIGKEPIITEVEGQQAIGLRQSKLESEASAQVESDRGSLEWNSRIRRVLPDGKDRFLRVDQPVERGNKEL